jgi:hypothetical protein
MTAGFDDAEQRVQALLDFLWIDVEPPLMIMSFARPTSRR